METQWYKLRKSLNSVMNEGLKNQFFRRLIIVLTDPFSGPSDKIKAYYDALASAHAHKVTSPSLPLFFNDLKNKLAASGLKMHNLTGEVQLDENEISTLDTDVYSSTQRRFLEKPIMDAALITRLQRLEFTRYNGRGQQTAIRVALTSPDDSTLFVNLPTGCGKTLLIHALMLTTPSHRLNLVVVPTVALAIEQEKRVAEILKSSGQHHGGPYAWFSGQSDEVRTLLRERLKGGGQRILFCSPEAARTSLLPILFQLAKHDQLGSLIIDEAHLVDQWGAGFRPDFQLLAPLVQSLQSTAPRGIRKILMSATFSSATLETLKNLFTTPEQVPIEVNANFLRPEPGYFLTQTDSPRQHEQQILLQVNRMPRPLILYATEVEDAKRWYGILLEHGYNRIGLFHGDTGANHREELIHQWNKDQLDIMVATSAFGVGMDKSDVRSVLHVAVPENIDRYYQECGRSGRDGNASIVHLVYYASQMVVAKRLSQERLISSELGYERWSCMYQSREPKTGSRFKVDLTTQHSKISYDSPKNLAWNWKTLLLMKRAGFIQIFFSEPQLPLEEELNEKQLTDFYSNYFSHVEVETILDGHRDQNVWNEVIGGQRLLEFGARSNGYNHLIRWINNQEISLCGLLADFYTSNGYSPESACGGCPGCRAKGNDSNTPTLGEMVQPVSGWYQASKGFPGEVQRMYYKGKGKQPRGLLHEWKHLIAFLLQKRMVTAVRTSTDVHQMLNAILPVNNFWCSLTPDEPDSLWNELVLVMPGEIKMPRTGFSENNKIFFIPDHLQDPLHPQRIWVDCDHGAVSIEDFKRKLSHVDN